jgi:GNAT superfamily N-acetyltransferase
MSNFTIRYPPRSLALELPGDAAWFIAVEPHDRLDIVGWSRLEIDDACMIWFAVRSYVPRQGVGRACLTAACAWADARSTTICLTSKPHLVEWYESAGFLRHEPYQWMQMAAGQTFMIREPHRLTR